MKTKINAQFLIYLLTLSTLIAACSYKLEPEDQCNFVMNSQIQRVSWKNQFPVDLYIDDSVPEEFRMTIRAAAAQWDYKMGMTMFNIKEDFDVPKSPKKDDMSVIYWKDSWEEDKSEEQGRTTIFWKNDRITEADIRINNKDFNFTALDFKDPVLVDFESLMVHELGHVLGLSHVEKGKGSVMEEHLAHATQRRTPGDEDSNALKCEYL